MLQVWLAQRILTILRQHISKTSTLLHVVSLSVRFPTLYYNVLTMKHLKARILILTLTTKITQQVMMHLMKCCSCHFYSDLPTIIEHASKIINVSYSFHCTLIYAYFEIVFRTRNQVLVGHYLRLIQCYTIVFTYSYDTTHKPL